MPQSTMRNALEGLHHDYAARLARIAEQCDAEEWEVREVFEERSSIRQYLGSMMRDKAEEAALDDTEAAFIGRHRP